MTKQISENMEVNESSSWYIAKMSNGTPTLEIETNNYALITIYKERGGEIKIDVFSHEENPELYKDLEKLGFYISNESDLGDEGVGPIYTMDSDNLYKDINKIVELFKIELPDTKTFFDWVSKINFN